jgi:type IV pilus assembly protein PilE
MKKEKGITLIELLIVIAVVGILAAVAVPIYGDYMLRARRADGKTCLEQVRAAQEMRRSERGSYSNSLAALQTTWGVAAACGEYTIVLNSATATTFIAVANPNTARQIPDGPLRINQNGVKTPADKWVR